MQAIPVKISRSGSDISLPEYATEGSVAFDLSSAETLTIQPGESHLVRTGLVISVPEGYTLLLVNRSSLFKKTGLVMPHGIGVIDQDYAGPEDELLIQLYNLTNQPAFIQKGDRLAQGILVPVAQASWQEIPLSDRSISRGGFGSTDQMRKLIPEELKSEELAGLDLSENSEINFPALDELSEAEKAKVAPFVSNMHQSIFAVKNLDQDVVAALFSRYSRAHETFRELLAREFLPPDTDSRIFQRSPLPSETKQRTEAFFKRVLIQYGDESVAELASAHLACEGVSMLAAEILESNRIGLSPLEKSTRYVEFDVQRNGRYQFFIDPALRDSEFGPDYLQITNALFTEYSRLIEPIRSYLKNRFPQDSTTSDRAYAASIRAKSCDILRALLPMSAQTNLGLAGNARAFEYLINKLLAHSLMEGRMIGEIAFQELKAVLPTLIHRPKEPHGQELQSYLKRQRQVIQDIYLECGQDDFEQELIPGVSFVRYDPDAQVNVLASLIFSQSNLPLAQVRNLVRQLSAEEQEELLIKAAAGRQNRFQKLPRAFESTDYEIEIVADLGVFKDLKRHRLCTIDRQPYTTCFGYIVPPEIVAIGVEDRYRNLMDQVNTIWQKAAVERPIEAEYLVPLGFLGRQRLKLNLRELAYLIELRSTPAGHPGYRFIALELYRQLEKIHPVFAKLVKPQTTAADLERLSAEKRFDCINMSS